MFDYWFLLTLTLGVIGIFWLVNKKIQSNNNDDKSVEINEQRVIIKKLDLENIEKKIVVTLEKILKRLRILVLRTDNNLSQFLKKLKSQKNDEKIFSVSKLTSCEIITEADRETTRVLEINYLESVKDNPNIDNFLKLAELYLNYHDFNSCRALLYKIWEIDNKNEKLAQLLKDLKSIECNQK